MPNPEDRWLIDEWIADAERTDPTLTRQDAARMLTEASPHAAALMRIAGLKRDDAEWMGWAWKRFTQPETMVAWIEAGLPVRAVNLAEGLTLQGVSPEMLPEVYTRPATGEPAQLVDIVLELGPNEVLSKVLDAAGV